MTRNVKDKALDNSFALNYTYTNDRITLLSLDLQYIDQNQPNTFDFYRNNSPLLSQTLKYRGKTPSADLYYSRYITTIGKFFELKFEGALSANFSREKANYSFSPGEVDADINYDRDKVSLIAQIVGGSYDIGATAGVKVEYNDNKISALDSIIGRQQFPTFMWGASFYIKPAIGLDLSLSGGSRMSTPSFIQVSPIFMFDENTTTRHIGNPALKPSYSTTVELNLSYSTDKLRINALVGYTNTKNDFNQTFFIKDDAYYTSWDNLSKSQKIYLYSSINYRCFYFMRAGLAFNLKNDIFKAENQKAESYFNYDIKALLNFFTNNGFSCDIVGIYNPKTYFYNSTQDDFFDLRISFSMAFKNNITISLTGYNLLNQYPTVHENGTDFTASNFVNTHTFSVHFGIMYTFGRKINNRSNLDLNTNEVKMED